MKQSAWSILLLPFLLFSCQDENIPELEYHFYKEFKSVGELKNTFEKIAALPGTEQQKSESAELWDSLKKNRQVPFISGDSVLFLYEGNVTSVSWAGDFNRWNPATDGYSGVQFGNTGIWYITHSYPSDARLDYKLVVNGSWILDPANPLVQYSGFGPNSELRMPLWEFPMETILINGVTRGTLGENVIITSKPENLGYNVQFRVYLPTGYDHLTHVPVMYVTDGQEYADDRMGAMLIVLDNLIFSGNISPVIVVFIDPRDPSNLQNNRRALQYTGNIKFSRFLAEELIPFIDSTYKTDTSAAHTAILGTSYGGWNSAFTGFHFSGQFGLIGIHSPAFDQDIINAYDQSLKLPLKIYMSTGVINDTQDMARQMKLVLESKGYLLQYTEVNQGHSWGNWRGLIDEPLLFFFGTNH